MKTNILTKSLWIAALLAALGHGALAGAFDLTDTAGKRHRLSDYRGRWVIVNFWATWCTPCIEEIPEIAAFRRAHREVVVIGVAIDATDIKKTQRFAARVGHDYPLVISDERIERELGPIRGLPMTRIYDPTGALVYDRLGRVNRKSLEQATIAKAIGAQA